jgi:hypothetical protein
MIHVFSLKVDDRRNLYTKSDDVEKNIHLFVRIPVTYFQLTLITRYQDLNVDVIISLSQLFFVCLQLFINSLFTFLFRLKIFLFFHTLWAKPVSDYFVLMDVNVVDNFGPIGLWTWNQFTCRLWLLIISWIFRRLSANFIPVADLSETLWAC